MGQTFDPSEEHGSEPEGGKGYPGPKEEPPERDMINPRGGTFIWPPAGIATRPLTGCHVTLRSSMSSPDLYLEGDLMRRSVIKSRAMCNRMSDFTKPTRKSCDSVGTFREFS
jgi:hypothetical protein